MEVLLELHAPGLDMEHSRWTYHLIFMKEVHEQIEHVVECARAAFRSQGRGTVFASRKEWMQIVRDAVTEHKTSYPCRFVDAREAVTRFDFGLMAAGYRQILAEYDPERQLLLTVEHHPEGLLSCYVIAIGDGQNGESA